MINDRPRPGECDKRMRREHYNMTIYRGKDATTATIGRDSGGYGNIDDTTTTLGRKKQQREKGQTSRV